MMSLGEGLKDRGLLAEGLEEQARHSFGAPPFGVQGKPRWRASAPASSPSSSTKMNDDQMILALIYYHAISIYLSGTFDYHTHWNDHHIPTPMLPPNEIQKHVTVILNMVNSTLEQTNLAGILFFFPLRVAGSRVQSVQQRSEISRMLRHISRRGFVVADAFTVDLEELWERKGIVVVSE